MQESPMGLIEELKRNMIKSKVLFSLVLTALPLGSAAAQANSASAAPADDKSDAEVTPASPKFALSDAPVQWVAEKIGKQPVSDNDVVNNLTLQSAMKENVTLDAIEAAKKSGRLKEIRKTDLEKPDGLKKQLLPVSQEQYEKLALQLKIDKPKNAVRLFIDTQDNDGMSKMNLIITPPGAGDNFLIISEGAHVWTKEYAATKLITEKELSTEVEAGRAQLLFSNAPSQDAQQLRKDPDPDLHREMRKVLDKLLGPNRSSDQQIDIYLSLADKDDKDALPSIGIMRTREGRPILLLNTAGRNMLSGSDKIDAALAHEVTHYLNKDDTPEAIAAQHNLPFPERIKAGQEREERADAGGIEALSRGESAARKAALVGALDEIIDIGDKSFGDNVRRQSPDLDITPKDIALIENQTTEHPSAEDRTRALERRLRADGTYLDRAADRTPVGDHTAAEAAREQGRGASPSMAIGGTSPARETSGT